MRYAMTSLIVHFRSTLDFFENRDRAMMKYHPTKFPRWRRGDKYFNLINTDDRKVIRFEANRLVIRSEGHESLDSFNDCLEISLDILINYFNVKDIFFLQLELYQLKNEKSLFHARHNFAKKCLSNKYGSILPTDGDTDYSITYDRNEHVDDDFNIYKHKKGKNTIKLNFFIVLGPVTGHEVRERFLEFKENSELEQYKTHANVSEYALLCGTRVSIYPGNKLKFFPVEKINNYIQRSIQKSEDIWKNTFGE